eukprot:m.321294 g.321294  ORF g.321294 m.321294 type:complete len:64 (-) comp16527_c0_seq9:371-562(-)
MSNIYPTGYNNPSLANEARNDDNQDDCSLRVLEVCNWSSAHAFIARLARACATFNRIAVSSEA